MSGTKVSSLILENEKRIRVGFEKWKARFEERNGKMKFSGTDYYVLYMLDMLHADPIKQETCEDLTKIRGDE